jgi:RNase P subunit RPR2
MQSFPTAGFCSWTENQEWVIPRIYRARKQYLCDTCHQPIHPTEHYQRTSKKKYTRWWTVKQCIPCTTQKWLG